MAASETLAPVVDKPLLLDDVPSGDRTGANASEPNLPADLLIDIEDRSETLPIIIGTGRFLQTKTDIAEIFVGDEGIVSVTPISSTLVYIFANGTGSTELQMLGNDGKAIAASTITVVLDEQKLQKELRAEAPLADVGIEAKGNRVEATGEAATIDQALDVDRFLDGQEDQGRETSNRTVLSGAHQVNLRVRIGEVDRNEITRLGIDWRGLVDASSFQFGFGFGNPGTDDGNAGAAAFSLNSGNFDFNAVVDALKQEGAIEMLAEPNLTVLNGNKATFLAGGEIPVPVRAGPVGETNVIFKPFGVSLEFKPTLLSGNRIQLDVRPEVSSIAEVGEDSAFEVDGLFLPTFNIRRADTTVQMASGQTLAIAGLFEQQDISVLSKLPLFGDLPIIGALFRSERYERNETELIILITPYIVRPSDQPISIDGLFSSDGS